MYVRTRGLKLQEAKEWGLKKDRINHAFPSSLDDFLTIFRLSLTAFTYLPQSRYRNKRENAIFKIEIENSITTFR